jgi:head-tail adaptor
MRSAPTTLREPISLVAVLLSEKEDGTCQEIAKDLANVWADIRALLPPTLVEADGWGKNPFPPAFYRVRIRYQPLEFQRICWRKKVYGLAAPATPDPTRQWLDFTVCEKQ